MAFDKKTRERAKGQARGMVRICIDGRYMEKDEDKVGIEYWGAVPDEKFQAIREFLLTLTT